MIEVYEALLASLPPLRGGHGCTPEALDQWEHKCGWRLPQTYREFVQRFAGASFEDFVTFEYRNKAKGSVRDWLQIAKPTSSEKAGLELGVEEHAEVLRDMMSEGLGAVGQQWAPSLVPFAIPVSGHGWVAFDFSFNAANPPVVFYDDQIAWEDEPRYVITLIAIDFLAFLHCLHQPGEIEYPTVPAPPLTPEQAAWHAHVDKILGVF